MGFITSTLLYINNLYKGHTSSYLSQYMHYSDYHLELLVILL